MAESIGNFEVPVNVPIKMQADFSAIVGDLNAISRKMESRLSEAGKDSMRKLESAVKAGTGGAVHAVEQAVQEMAQLLSKNIVPSDFKEQLEKELGGVSKLVAKNLGGSEMGGGIGASFLGDINDLKGADKVFSNMENTVIKLTAMFKTLQKGLSEFVTVSETSFAKLAELMQRYVGQETVAMQAVMADDRRAEREKERLYQEARVAQQQANRLQIISENEASFKRRQMIKDESAQKNAALKEDNLILNSYLQQQVVKTKESLDRRQQFQRFFLDSTRSVFRAGSSAVSSIWQGLYSTIGAIAGRGEGGLLSIVLRRSKERTQIYEAENRERMSMMSKFSEQGNKGVMGALAGTSQLGGMLRNLAMGAGAGLGVGAVFNIGSDFMEQLRVTAALTGATEEQFQKLRKTSIDLGKDISLPGVSAKDAAEAMGNLARSGFSVEDSINAAKGVLSLARGANLDFAQSSEIVGKSLNVFGINAKNAIQVSDAFTGALSLAPQSITDIQNAVARGGGTFIAFQRGADTARNNMEKFLGTTASLIKITGRSGEEVGTGLKRFFEVFQNPTKPAKAAIDQLSRAAGIAKGAGNIMFDAEGKTRKFNDTVFLLKKGVAGLGTEQQRAAVLGQIFGSEAGGIARALASENFNLEKAQIQIRQLGDSAKIAAARNAGLKGAFDALRSQFETFAILIYEKVDKPLGNFVTTIATIIDKVANAGGVFTIIRQGLLGAAAGLGAIIAAKGAVEVFQYMKIAIGGLLSPIGLLTLAAAGIGTAFAIAYKTSEPFRKFVGEVKLQAKKLFEDFVKRGIPAIVDFGKKLYSFAVDSLQPVGDWFKKLWKRVRDFADNFGPVLSAAIDLAKVAFDQFISAFKGADINSIFGQIGSAARTAFDFVKTAFNKIVGAVKWASSELSKAWDSNGIIGVITEPFVGIKNFFVSTFRNIDWGSVITTILGGIRTIFAAVGRRIGLIVGSDEFRNTLLIAFGTLGGVIGSAVLGLIEGLVDGLRKSELGRKIGDALKNLINPIEIVKDIFGSLMGNPGSIVGLILRGGLLAAIAMLAFKIKDAFSKTSKGLKLGLQFAFGDKDVAAQMAQQLGKAERESEKAKIKIRSNIEQAFGSGVVGRFATNVALAGAAVGRFGDRIKEIKLPKLLDSAFTKAVELTAPAIASAKSAFETKFGAFVSDAKNLMKDGFGTAIMGEMPALVGTGAMAGGGLAALIVGNDPAAKFAGLTAGITGVISAINLARQATDVFGSALAGIATGGILGVFAAVSFAIGIFAKHQADAKQKTEDHKTAIENMRNALRDVVTTAGTAGQSFRISFAQAITNATDETSKSLIGLSKRSHISLGDLAAAFENGGKGINKFTEPIKKEIADAEKRIQSLELMRAGAEGTDTSGYDKQIDRLKNIINLKQKDLEAFGNTKSALQEEIDLNKAKAKLEDASRKHIEENKTSVEKNRDATRSLRDAWNEVKDALVDAMNAGKPRELQKSIDDTAAASESFFKTLKDNNLTLDNFATGLGSGSREARDAFNQTQDAIAGIISGLQLSGASQADINKLLDAQKQKLIDNAVAQGAPRAEAQRFFDEAFAGYAQLDARTLSFLQKNAEAISSIGSRIDNTLRPKLAGVVARANIGQPLRDSLNAFLAEPTSPKNIQALLNLGVPQQKLAEFIQTPTQPKFLEMIAGVNQDPARNGLQSIYNDYNNKKITFQTGFTPLPGQNRPRGIPAAANGAIVNTPQLTLIGEAGREVVIPLTRPKRAVDLYQQSGLEKVLAAGGLTRPSNAMPSKSSNVTVNQTFHVNGDTNLRKASRKAMASGYDLGRQLRGI